MVDLGGILGAIIIGGLAGWVASKIMGTDASMGVVANVLVGVAGAVVGNLLLPMFGISGTSGWSIWSFVVALVGALIFLFVVSLFTRKRV